MRSVRLAYAILFGVAVLFSFINFRLVGSKQANLQILASPSVATLKIDGKKSSVGSSYVSPGKHTLELSYPNFETQKQSFITRDDSGIKISIALLPINQQGYKFLQKNKFELTSREQIGGDNYNSDVDQQYSSYPLFALLPHNGEGYTIDYGTSAQYPDDPAKKAITVSYDNTLVAKERFVGYHILDLIFKLTKSSTNRRLWNNE